MAIKDRKKRRLVRLGVIRLGHKETKKKKRQDGSTYEISYPVQDDHFVLTDAPEVAAFYGNEARELDVMLPFPDIVRNFDAFYQVWASGVLLCQGDGEYVQYAAPVNVVNTRGKDRLRAGDGETLVTNGVAKVPFSWNGDHFESGEHVPCPGADADAYPHCQFCKLSALLKVMMADPSLFRMGYYQISTGSGRNYDTIMGTLEAMPADKLNGIPFKLRLVEESTTYTEKGKRHSTKKWFLQLEPDPEYTRELYARAAARQIGQGIVEETPQIEAVIATDDPDWEGYDNGHVDYIDEVLDENENPPAPENKPEPTMPGAPDFSDLPDGDWGAFYTMTWEGLGFDNAGSARAAAARIHGTSSPKDVPFGQMYGDLVDYQASKNAN